MLTGGLHVTPLAVGERHTPCVHLLADFPRLLPVPRGHREAYSAQGFASGAALDRFVTQVQTPFDAVEAHLESVHPSVHDCDVRVDSGDLALKAGKWVSIDPSLRRTDSNCSSILTPRDLTSLRSALSISRRRFSTSSAIVASPAHHRSSVYHRPAQTKSLG